MSATSPSSARPRSDRTEPEGLVEGALRVARRVPVFACKLDKRPLDRGGFHVATQDPDAIRASFSRPGAALIAMPTGEPSGLSVLDIDGPRHPEAVEWLDRHRDRLPATLVVQTRSGGQHWFFRHAGGIRNSAGKVAVGIDTRGDGGYVILWAAHGCPRLSAHPPAPWPSWLKPPPKPAWTPPAAQPWQGDDRAARRYAEGALRRAIERVASAGPGTRNDTLNAEVFGLMRLAPDGLHPSEIAHGLATAAAVAGLDQREIEATLRSALSARSAA